MRKTMPLNLIRFLIFFICLFFYSCGSGDNDPIIPETMETLTVSDFTTSIAENSVLGTSLGTVMATSNKTPKYSITSQTVAGALSINSTTGELSVADASLFDFETRQNLTAIVQVSAGNLKKNLTVTINITDVVEEQPVTYTVWNGPMLTFTKTAGGDPKDTLQQDAITANVVITRGNTGGQIYNIVKETFFNKENSPVDTEWALGTIDEVANLRFQSFRIATGGKPKTAVGKNMVVHLITDDVYISIKFTAWDDLKAGGFAYERSTPTSSRKVSN